MDIKIVLGPDKELDGYDPREVIAFTFAQAKFNNFVTRGGSLSTRFGLNYTPNNLAQLKDLRESRSTSPEPYRKYDVSVKVAGLPVFYGSAVIEEASDKIYLRLFGSEASFFTRIGDKGIRELDLSAFNHDWTAANVQTGKQATTGYCYPNINYGRWTGQTLAARAYTDFYPAMYVKAILEAAASEEGYTLGPGFSDSNALPFCLQKGENRTTVPAQITQTGTADVVYYNFGFGVSTWYSNQLDTITSDPGNHVNTAGDEPLYLMREGGVYDFEVFLDYAPPTGGIAIEQDFRAYLYKSSQNTLAGITSELGLGNTPGEVLTDGLAVRVPSGATGETSFTISGVEYDASYPYIWLFFSPTSTTGVGLESFSLLSGSYVKCTAGVEPMLPGEIIAIADNLPVFQIKDIFIEEAVQQNGLIIADDTAKTVSLVRFDDIAALAPVGVDWSSKVDYIDYPKYPAFEYRLDGYGQVNVFEWEEGDDEDPAYVSDNNIGRGTIAIDDNTLEPEVLQYTSKFAASAVQRSFTDEFTLFIPRYSDTSLAYDEADIEPTPRIVQIAVDDSQLVQVSGQAALGTNANATFKGYDVFIAENYTAFTALLTRLKLVTVLVRLTPEDINRLDITRPVYLLGSYWFIRQVKQWKANRSDSTLVELLRL